MKSLSQFIAESQESEDAKIGIYSAMDFVSPYPKTDSLEDEFELLCKYADFFNLVEQQWHSVNKSTATSRAIMEETDKMFEVCRKYMMSVNQLSSFEYKSKMGDDDGIGIFDNDYLTGKKLATVIKRTDEWKQFYKWYKKLKDRTIDGHHIDDQLRMLIKMFILYTDDFVEDVLA